MATKEIVEIREKLVQMRQLLPNLKREEPYFWRKFSKKISSGEEQLFLNYLKYQNEIVKRNLRPLERIRTSAKAQQMIKNNLYVYTAEYETYLSISPDANKLLSLRSQDILPYQKKKEDLPFFMPDQIKGVRNLESIENLLSLMLAYQLYKEQEKNKIIHICEEISYYFPYQSFKEYASNLPIRDWEEMNAEQRYDSLRNILSYGFNLKVPKREKLIGE